MDILKYNRDEVLKKNAPLASRMRPITLDEVVGQEHIIGRGRFLSRAIQADKLTSLIFYGPPGTGKTTLAQVIAHTTNADFFELNATTSGKKDMEDAVQRAESVLGMEGKRTILFIDEIHRFNKAQQDFLLPFVENGTVILIGATTENPYFEVNRALLSRSVIFELRPLSVDNVKVLVRRAISDKERGLGNFVVDVDDDAIDFIADISNGDARTALNAIELAVLTTQPIDGKIKIDVETAQSCIQKRVLGYDKNGDGHYDTISAFIKSMRGSDPDAAVYYLAKMIDAGEDIKFISRRIMICASEDVGNADPMALVVATSAAEAVERLGLPEARIVLAQAAIYVATAPKSNSSIVAIDSAIECVRTEPLGKMPSYLQDAHYHGAENLGRGIGYKYPHSFGGYVEQQYLPDRLKDRKFYKPSGNGKEKDVLSWKKK